MKLKDLREDSDLTQAEIANYLHIKQNTYSQYENGQRQLPVDILIGGAAYAAAKWVSGIIRRFF